MDELIKRMEEALEKEFGHILKPNDDQAWHKPAVGLIEKCGIYEVAAQEPSFRLERR